MKPATSEKPGTGHLGKNTVEALGEPCGVGVADRPSGGDDVAVSGQLASRGEVDRFIDQANAGARGNSKRTSVSAPCTTVDQRARSRRRQSPAESNRAARVINRMLRAFVGYQ